MVHSNLEKIFVIKRGANISKSSFKKTAKRSTRFEFFTTNNVCLEPAINKYRD